MSIASFAVFFTLSLAICVNAKMIVVVYDNIINCDEFANDDPGMLDMTTLQLIAENDTHTFINGSIKFLKEVTVWKSEVYLEHKVQGEWKMQAFDRKYDDLCEAMDKPTEPFHPYLEGKKRCPFSPGDEWMFDMEYVELSPTLMAAIPPHYIGNWRASFVGTFTIDGVEKHECKRAYVDIFEE